MKDIEMMDKKADKVILKWAAGGLLGNLAPPPFDSLAVIAAMAKMGVDIALIYEDVELSKEEVYRLAKIIFKGVSGVNLAANFGTSLLKYVPGVNVAVALLVQPPMVMALTYAAGKSYKRYYSTVQRTGKKPDDNELVKFAKNIYKENFKAATKKLKKI